MPAMSTSVRRREPVRLPGTTLHSEPTHWHWPRCNPAWMSFPTAIPRPFGKTRPFEIFAEAFAQSIESFGDFLSGWPAIPSPNVDFNARNNSASVSAFTKKCIFRLLPDRLRVENAPLIDSPRPGVVTIMSDRRAGSPRSEEFPLGNRLLQVGLLSSIASSPLWSATILRAYRSALLDSLAVAPFPVSDSGLP